MDASHVVLEHDGITVSLESLIKYRRIAKKLLLSSQQRVNSTKLGTHRSAFRGRGIDFSEVRVYQPGDDIRSMDWRVTARTGKAHTKLYHQERERSVLFLVDLSSNMHFGSRVAFKSVIAAQICSLLAWGALSSGDRVGGIVYDDNTIQEVRPLRAHQSILALLNLLANKTLPPNATPKPKRLARALQRLANLTKPGSLVILISDFSDLEHRAQQILSQLSRHNEVMSIFVYDQLEKEPPKGGRYGISNQQDFYTLNTYDQHAQMAYRQRFSDFFQHIYQVMMQQGIHILPIATHDNLLTRLQCFYQDQHHNESLLAHELSDHKS